MVLRNDRYRMNWTEGTAKWGTVHMPETLRCTVNQKQEGDICYERYVFTNISKKDVFTSLKDISIYTPFNDDYIDPGLCMTQRCHTHIWCGDDVSYIMALRMGGEPPHLGLVLTEGGIGGYSQERDLSKNSNDRGDFILHPSPVSLAPGQSFTVAWTLFPHRGKNDFYSRLGQYCPHYIEILADRYIVFLNENIHLQIRPVFDFTRDDVFVMRNGSTVGFRICDGVIFVDEKPDAVGEYRYFLQVKGIKTHCCILVQPEFEELLRRRCEFIIQNQQYHNAFSGLDGAYLVYDNEEKHIFYHLQNDYNGGRERVCMGILLAGYLRNCRDEKAECSLKEYTAYVERELFDEKTGEVSNDYGHDCSYKRPYNYSWVSLFYLELYSLYGNRKYLDNAYKILETFYEKEDGAHFYAIEIPLRRIVEELEAAGMTESRDRLLSYFEAHCDYIMECETSYPSHEVNFEQSIVAPAANMLLQMYQVTGNEEYFNGAKQQLNVLELFNGLQPDYHMHEVAIRHWDGYWFGKRQLYGDTFPHYWSALTAEVYRAYADITGSVEYVKKADMAYRGVLSLFFPDGSASCAFVYPVSVNGRDGGYFDPYANDQDWGLYFILRDRSRQTLHSG